MRSIAWLKLAVNQRLVLTLAVMAAWSWVAARQLLRRLFVRLPDARLALLVDRADPALQDRIATGVQFASGAVGEADSNSPQLVHAVIDEACQAARRVVFTAVLDHRRARRRALILAALGLLAAIGGGIAA